MLHTTVKTKELVFHRPNPHNIVFPPAVDSIEQVRVAKLLGVYLQCNFCCEEHVKFILSLCSQRVYLLKLLRDRGLSASQLQLVCQAIIISRLAYALPAWGGFLSADNRNRINGFLRRLYKCGFTVRLLTTEQLLFEADNVLFRKVLIDGHCLLFSHQSKLLAFSFDLRAIKTPHLQVRVIQTVLGLFLYVVFLTFINLYPFPVFFCFFLFFFLYT